MIRAASSGGGGREESVASEPRKEQEEDHVVGSRQRRPTLSRVASEILRRPSTFKQLLAQKHPSEQESMDRKASYGMLFARAKPPAAAAIPAPIPEQHA